MKKLHDDLYKLWQACLGRLDVCWPVDPSVLLGKYTTDQLREFIPELEAVKHRCHVSTEKLKHLQAEIARREAQ